VDVNVLLLGGLFVVAAALVQGTLGLGLSLIGAPAVAVLDPTLMPGGVLLLGMVMTLLHEWRHISAPKSSPPPAAPTLPEGEEPVVRVAGASLCSLFSTAEISQVLSLSVQKVAVSKCGPCSVCTWKTVKPVEGGGIVTITRGDGSQYAAFEKEITAEANAKKARGRKELEGVGDATFAMGASVIGVPKWYAAVVQGGVLTGIRMAGAGSSASIATAKAFMIEILARG
jgi:hypothetical protein